MENSERLSGPILILSPKFISKTDFTSKHLVKIQKHPLKVLLLSKIDELLIIPSHPYLEAVSSCNCELLHPQEAHKTSYSQYSGTQS